MKKYYYLLGIIILIVILSRLNLKAIITYYAQLNLIHLGLINLIILPTIFIKALRWRYFLRLQGINYSVADSLISYWGGIFAGIITPGRAGEAMKAVYLKVDKGIPFSEGIASVTMDRLFDLYLLILLGVIGSWNFPGFRARGNNLIIIFISSLVIIAPLVLFNKAIIEKTARLIYKTIMSKIDKNLFDSQFKNFLSANKRIVTKRIYPAFLLTVLSHFFYFGQCFLLARLMSFNISFMTVVFFVSVANLLSLLPITLWGFGTREGVLVYCFSLVGLSAESAISYSFLLFTSFYLISGAFSFIGWLLKGNYGPGILNQQG